MELKCVEIVGFKSFADKLTLTFHGGITAIVGPNGSGKSNVADAIRWVLGEQSAKSLRGARMEDVIFAGTERRRPVNFAQVTLTLGNQDRSLSYDADEVAISRKMYRSGESEYLINGVKCRLRDVQELLMDTGIGKDGYSIIGQGRIDQLLSNKPQDRRMIFEEAAGIVKFKVRREEANKQLLEEQANLQRVSDILEEASSRLEPLEKQAAEARKHRNLTEELKQLEVQAFLRQYEQQSNQYRSLEEKTEQLLAQLEEAKERRQQVKEAAEICQKEAEEAAQNLAKAMQELNDLRVLRESQDGERKLYMQNMEQLRKEQRDVKEHLEDTKGRLARRQDTYEKEQKQLAELRQKKETQKEQQALLLETQKQLAKEHDESRQEKERAEASLETLRQDVEQLKETSARQEVLQEQEQGQQGDMQQKLEKLTAEHEAQYQQLEAAQKELEAARGEFEQCNREIADKTDEISRVRAKLREAETRLEEVEKEIHQVESRIRWLKELEKEYEGYSGSVKWIMQQKQQDPQHGVGILGTVADLIQVPPHLATALEIALGGAVQNIVTDHLQTAQYWIEALRARKAGRATFQPLDRVQGREIRRDEKLLAMQGVLGYAPELIGYDPRYSVIISRLLGNVVIAQDFESAAAVARSYGQYLRVVTLKGDIFNIGGSITGGSTGGKNASILNRKGELSEQEARLDAARKTGQRAMQEVAGLSEERQQKTREMEALSQRREALSQKTAQCQSIYDQNELRTQMLRTQLEEAKRDTQMIGQSIEKNERFLEEVRLELEQKQQAYQEEADRMKAIQEREEEDRKKEEEMRSQILRVRIELSTSEQLIASMMNSGEREAADMRQDEEQIERYEERLKEAEREMGRLESEALRSEAELGQVGNQIQAFGEKIEELTQVRDDKEEQRRESIVASEEVVQWVTDLEKEQYRLDTQASRVKKELAELQDRIWEKYELTYNAALRLELPKLENVNAANRRMSELREELRGLGAVNLHAVEEYQTLKERCDFLTSQLEDVKKAEESLRDIIRQLTEQMGKQFQEGFGKISEQFNQVFRKMFGGGKGMLRLEEEDHPLESGIEIVAQPPGKTLKSMTALSGGERALTAIAILFAIQQLKPAPFCILDEIEAALDDANVKRYADFLKTLCDTTQFIVITHRKGTMEAATVMYGITMEEKGVSKCISVKFE